VAYISAVTAGAPLDIGGFSGVLPRLIFGDFWHLSGLRGGCERVVRAPGCRDRREPSRSGL